MSNQNTKPPRFYMESTLESISLDKDGAALVFLIGDLKVPFRLAQDLDTAIRLRPCLGQRIRITFEPAETVENP